MFPFYFDYLARIIQLSGHKTIVKAVEVMEARTYIVDNEKMKFNSVGFRRRVDTYCKANLLTKKEFEQNFAEKIGWDRETIHKWIYGKSNPNDLETIKKLANKLNIHDFKLLLISVDGGDEMKRLTERQITAVKKIYDICISFLSEFYNTDGFNDYWYKFKAQGIEDPEKAITEYTDSLHEKINLVLDQEFFDLRNTEIYNELCEFVSEDLVNIYDGKLSYAYRFEADPSGNPSTSEDYSNAMDRLNKIIEEYV